MTFWKAGMTPQIADSKWGGDETFFVIAGMTLWNTGMTPLKIAGAPAKNSGEGINSYKRTLPRSGHQTYKLLVFCHLYLRLSQRNVYQSLLPLTRCTKVTSLCDDCRGQRRSLRRIRARI